MSDEVIDQPAAAAAPQHTIEDVIARYVALRDKKAALKAELDKATEKIDEGMVRLERFMLDYLNKTGLNSVGTGDFCAYKASVTSVTTGDKAAFLDYVKENEAWGLLDVRPSKTAVVEFRTENDDLPPGINWREENVVRIRRA